MRLFTEDDVLQLIGLKQVADSPEHVIAEGERVGLVCAFEVEVPGGPDQARAFAHWMKTGEIPDWRLDQLAGDAVKDAVSELRNTATLTPEQHREAHMDSVRAHREEETRPIAIDGVALIAVERARQVTEEGWSAEHDDDHDNGELAAAAATYALQAGTGRPGLWGTVEGQPFKPRYSPLHWPWDDADWKPSANPIHDLVKAGALIAAEIDRLQRDSGESS